MGSPMWSRVGDGDHLCCRSGNVFACLSVEMHWMERVVSMIAGNSDAIMKSSLGEGPRLERWQSHRRYAVFNDPQRR